MGSEKQTKDSNLKLAFCVLCACSTFLSLHLYAGSIKNTCKVHLEGKQGKHIDPYMNFDVYLYLKTNSHEAFANFQKNVRSSKPSVPYIVPIAEAKLWLEGVSSHVDDMLRAAEKDSKFYDENKALLKQVNEALLRNTIIRDKLNNLALDFLRLSYEFKNRQEGLEFKPPYALSRLLDKTGHFSPYYISGSKSLSAMEYNILIAQGVFPIRTGLTDGAAIKDLERLKDYISAEKKFLNIESQKDSDVIDKISQHRDNRYNYLDYLFFQFHNSHNTSKQRVLSLHLVLSTLLVKRGAVAVPQSLLPEAQKLLKELNANPSRLARFRPFHKESLEIIIQETLELESRPSTRPIEEKELDWRGDTSGWHID